ncbi:SURF1 family protein [Acidovorax sp. JMULE5]|uniref:SURF1 family protein n=1 Tax=Acidovorax sp. JMULE5 TaxID=2518343 RepID=UPI0015A40D60|nr:SURF1 family protein [Acidovorax sp. JMULE5]QLA79218.1 SURF1 family protein [Acidovorax sp. JMULE5]
MPSHPTAPPPQARRLRQAVLAVVGIALFLGFIALGTWQVQRRAWKLALIERVEQRVHAAPKALPLRPEWPQVSAATHEYLPVTAQGRWLPEKTVLTQALTELGSGFWVMTPLQLADGSQLLVNRGFVPQEQRAQWLATPMPASTPTSTTATVQGLLRMSEPDGGFLRTNAPAEQRWYSRDITAIGHWLQLPETAPFFIDAGLPPAQGAAAPPAADTSWPRAGMTVIRFHNSHLVYALTWYGLALMVAGAGWYVARYERRLRGFARPATTFAPDDTSSS